MLRAIDFGNRSPIMSKLLFRLRHVPEDEASEVRDLLESHEIEYFETSAGLFGISFPAIWVRRDRQFEIARRLIDEYQAQRRELIRSQYRQAREKGEARTAIDYFRENPARFLGSLVMAALVLYFSVRFFFSF